MKIAWFLVLVGSINPFLMLLSLMFFLLLFSLNLVFLVDNYLFSYLIFLLFMGGLMVMLMYFCSIILSEKCFTFFDFFFSVLLIFIMSMMLFSVSESFFDLEPKLLFVYFEFIDLLKYILLPYSIFSLLFIIYLLGCLVVVYEIVSRCGGPLRMKV